MIIDPHPAYVLHGQPYRETSLLLDIFSRDHGRVGLVARGVRGARAQPLRVLLQPLQPLLLSWGGRGELVQLRGVEAAGAALLPQGDALLAAFYVNELLMRLLPRGEAQVALFWRYAQCLGALAGGDDFAWELRRFERDLLAELGYGLTLECEADGTTPIDAERWYRYDAESGAQPLPGPRATAAVSGATLLALLGDQRPEVAGLRELRGLMRRVLLHHLGGRELRSWQLLADLAAHRR
jgi:DNA repair protein RecO (recombination protein O)